MHGRAMIYFCSTLVAHLNRINSPACR